MSVLLLSPAAWAEPNTAHTLTQQMHRLVELMRDGYAVEYRKARMVQTIKRGPQDEVALVVFTLESFNGGNNHTQYLAAFAKVEGENLKPHFQFLDVISIGGKGWRTVHPLKVRWTHDPKANSTVFSIDALEVVGTDAPNSPSKPTTATIVLTYSRLTEQQAK